jgi:hypothetical protein
MKANSSNGFGKCPFVGVVELYDEVHMDVTCATRTGISNLLGTPLARLRANSALGAMGEGE